MKQTSYDIANTIRMTRSLHKGTFLLVEGSTDARVYGEFIDEESCRVIPANGKDNAVAALTLLEKDSFEGIVSIVDADFQRIVGEEPEIPNLLWTDTHDLESMILSCNAVLDRFLAEYGSTNKINRLTIPVIDILLENAVLIGCLRWIASPAGDNIKLKFKGLEFGDIIDLKELEKRKLKIDIDRLLDLLRENSGGVEADNVILKKKIRTLSKKKYDPWQMCSGHDMIEILAQGVRHLFGNRRTKKVTVDEVDRVIRLVYSYEHFQTTRLYRAVKDWETGNLGFYILRKPTSID